MTDKQALRSMVQNVVATTRVLDMHTHLFPPAFTGLQMSGADHVLTYHYLIAELFRAGGSVTYDEFWRYTAAEQADVIWQHLFASTTPLSEAASGVVQIAQAFGVDMQRDGMAGLRSALQSVATPEYVDKVLDLAGVASVVMTNDPLDATERQYWLSGTARHPRFQTALRLDGLVNDFASAVPTLVADGYSVTPELTAATLAEVRRFLEDWVNRLQPLYLAFSAADTFAFPENSVRGRLLEDVILPLCEARRLPLALMIGARRRINPALQTAGDSTGKSSLVPVENLCRQYPHNKFLVTLLARENQHELAVTARKFQNLMPFGCWWFLNTDSLVREITRMRLELLGPTFVPQHSDARVLEHLLYKWPRARTVLADLLADKYEALGAYGWTVTRADVERDAKHLLQQNFVDFVKR